MDTCLIQLRHERRLVHRKFSGNAGGIHVPLDLIVQGRQDLHGVFQKTYLAVVAVQIILFPLCQNAKFDVVCRPVQKALEPLPAVLADDLIRILAAGKFEHLYFHPDGGKYSDGFAQRLLSGAVGIVGQDRLIRVTGQKPRLILRQRRAASRHRKGKIRLMQSDHVHIALAQNKTAFSGVFGKIECEHFLAFFVDQCVGRVDILRFGIVQHPTAEGDHIPPHVDNGDHHTVAEAVVKAPRIFGARTHQICIHQLRCRVALVLHMPQQSIPAVGRIAQTEVADRLHGKRSVFGEIFQRRRIFRQQKLGVKKLGRLPIGGQDPLAPLGKRIVKAVLRHPKSRSIRQKFDRFHIVEVFHTADKGYGVAAGTTAETVE